ncbi:MAG: hypothetical protein A3G18_11105 [Rhodospirillales bacterium RIFCSPLOWO2_12_FULL_58_28]|nr:MAG: hypothetical protein A3H92_10250 [Rhodospirillales bacterium RIFCSPLOWO2_02_FULL_58_16]OHC77747.1 MAG: hypothetical protein A3G18_11105 [Rhodospirillales bacterium RIFCSPLOWO2_12_FULL_58_28]
MLRPRPAFWFSLLAPRDGLAYVLERLSRTGSVELEAAAMDMARLDLAFLRRGLDEFAETARRHSVFWPAPAFGPPHLDETPEQMMERVLSCIRGWAAEAGPVTRYAESSGREGSDLRHLRHIIMEVGDHLPELHHLAACGPVLRSALYLLSNGVMPERIPASLVTRRLKAGDDAFLLVLGAADAVDALAGEMAIIESRVIAIPAWLPPANAETLTTIDTSLAMIDASRRTAADKLRRLNEKYSLSTALGDMERLHWFTDHSQETPITGQFARITGWSDDFAGRRLGAFLNHCRLPAVLMATRTPPAGKEPPIIFSNPAWVRPFEAFAGLLGAPGADHADPSLLVAFFAPLLFGCMFADVGQGAVLLVAGLVLRRRLPLLSLLVPGGACSILFGLLFGSVFARDDILPALWLDPLSRPAALLAFTLLAGAVILIAGILLDLMQARWRGEGLDWLTTSGGLLAAYLGLLASPLEPSAIWIVVSGVLWFLAGHAVASPRRRLGEALLYGLGEAAETLFQLAVNTLSFLRVGAFAIAHAGLSAAVLALADAAGPGAGFWTVLVLGNIFIIVLEGVVTGIQTTRLLLFEFFIRFFRADGRPFRALSPPTHRPQLYGGSAI